MRSLQQKGNRCNFKQNWVLGQTLKQIITNCCNFKQNVATLSKTTLSKMFMQIVATLSKMCKQIYLTIASEPSPIALSRRSKRAVFCAGKQQFSWTLLA
jgi:hypothetical protein